MLKFAHRINLLIIQRVQNSRNPDVNKPVLVSSTICIEDYVTSDVYRCAVCLEHEARKLPTTTTADCIIIIGRFWKAAADDA